MTKFVACIVMLFAALGLIGTVKPAETRVEFQAADVLLTAEELRVKLVHAMTSPDFIDMELSVVTLDDKVPHKVDQRLVIKSAMTKDKLFATMFDINGSLIAAFSMENKRVKEYRPEYAFGKEQRLLTNVVFEYDAYQDAGTDDTYLKSDRDCEFGSSTFSWITTDNLIVTMAFASIFLNTTEPKNEVVNGRECWVVSESSVVDEKKASYFAIRNTLAVDAQTWLPVQWTSVQTHNGSSLTRTRDMRKMVPGKMPANQVWDVSSLLKKKDQEKPVSK